MGLQAEGLVFFWRATFSEYFVRIVKQRPIELIPFQRVYRQTFNPLRSHPPRRACVLLLYLPQNCMYNPELLFTFKGPNAK